MIPLSYQLQILGELRSMAGWRLVDACIEDRSCVEKLADLIETSYRYEQETDKGLRYIELHNNEYSDLADLWR